MADIFFAGMPQIILYLQDGNTKIQTNGVMVFLFLGLSCLTPRTGSKPILLGETWTI